MSVFSDLNRLRRTAGEDDVAIIGMACIFPGATTVQRYWQNIVSKVDSITEPPPAWGAEIFYDPDSQANDRIYCKRGGFLGNLAQFNPLEYGIMPNSVNGGEPDHFLALRVAHEALADAGYLERAINRKAVEVIFGKGTYINPGHTNLIQHGIIIDQTLQILKQLHPEHTEEELETIKQELKNSLPPFNAEIVPALVPNIVTGRIANRLDLMGANYTIDAACASSLIAVEHGIQDLLARKCDLAIVGGVQGSMPPPILMIFCQLNALSRRGQIRPFDKHADGTLLGEGTGVIVLKRKEDAERDGDRIYALIKGLGTASDGRALGLMAPRLEGEELAMRRAYEMTGISPRTVALIEAHGTGTPIGDVTEIQALTQVFGSRDGTQPWCAVGSVKSMISHLIPAAGIAGLIKAALALYHKVLPPTLNCDEPNPKLDLEKTPSYINTETRPWIHSGPEPRRAGVNAFGFGGINAHAILEEYVGHNLENLPNFMTRWDSEVFIIQAASRQGLVGAGEQLLRFLSSNAAIELKDLAFTLNCPLREGGYRLAIVANSLKDLETKLVHGLQRLADSKCMKIKDRGGIFFFEEPLSREGTLAFLFPGEGSQYVGMLADLCLHFPEVRACFDRADRVFLENNRRPLPSQVVFPSPHANLSSVEESRKEDLWQMDMAVATVFTADHALFTLLNHLEIRPHAMVGHSSGEFVALLASGMVEIQDDDQLMQHLLQLNRMHDLLVEKAPTAILMAVGVTNPEMVATVVAENDSALTITMDNCPHQVILCGPEAVVAAARHRLENQGAICTFLPFNRAYHTSLFQSVCDQLNPFFDGLKIVSPHTTLYSCATAQPYPQNPGAIRQLALNQWARPVRFRETITAMYDAGIRMFVEAGPRSNLTGFVDDILRNHRYLAVSANVHYHSGITQLHYLIGLLAAHGVTMRLDHLYSRRSPQRVSFEAMGEIVQSGEIPEVVRLMQELPQLRLGRINRTSQSGTSSASSAALVTSSSIQDSANTHRTQIMQQYLQTMTQFLDTQQDVMAAFITRPRSGTPAVDGTEGNGKSSFVDASQLRNISASQGPFDIIVSSLTPGKQVVAICKLDPHEHVFLRHHTLGRVPSTLDETLTGLPIVPLTISLEMMAQIASLLLPGRYLVAMKSVRAHQWIDIEEQGRTLLLIAEHKSTGAGEEVEVRILAANDAVSVVSDNNNPFIEGTLVFGTTYPNPPDLDNLSHRSERACPWRPEQYYEDIMFHGPAFQSVVAINRLGDDSIEATLCVPTTAQLFRSHTQPQYFTDPVLLDGAGQVVGFWAWDRFERGFTIFPIGFEALNIYAPFPQESQKINCYTRIISLADGRIRSNMDLVTPEGNLLVRLLAWEDMRFFDWTRQFAQFLLAPQKSILSQSWSAPISHFPTSLGLQCNRFSESCGGIWPRILAYTILNRSERETWLRLGKSEKRRREWLLGRVVVKDAVRRFLKDRYRLDLCLADIEIVADEHGRPTVAKEIVEQVGCRLSLSIAHAQGTAVAVAGESLNQQGMGIDVEYMRQDHQKLERNSLTATEQILLAAVPNSHRDEWLLRLWCAKEAVAKALGRGMAGNPYNLMVRELFMPTGQVTVTIAGELARQLPHCVDKLFVAYTGREDALVFASALA